MYCSIAGPLVEVCEGSDEPGTEWLIGGCGAVPVPRPRIFWAEAEVVPVVRWEADWAALSSGWFLVPKSHSVSSGLRSKLYEWFGGSGAI